MSITSGVYQGDCLELMQSIPDGHVDCVIADLPYGTTQNRWDSVIPLDR
ncbi:MAG: site-specific DNA-methyltransferase, partial [Hymenobacter sp.]